MKNYWMAPLESILIKKLTLNLNMEQSQCITALTLFLTYIDKLLKKNLIMWLNLAFLSHVEPLNGPPPPSSFLKRAGLTNYRFNFSKQSSCMKTIPFTHYYQHVRPNIRYKFFTKCDISMQYKTFELDKLKKSFMLSSHYLVNSNTNVSPWNSNVLLI